MKDEQFADFALLFRLIHASRLPKGIDDADSCQLEQYHRETIEQGGRVRDHLRDGVEKALTRFANGFLTHPRNNALRRRCKTSPSNRSNTTSRLLRLIYRFLFLAVSEERNLITETCRTGSITASAVSVGSRKSGLYTRIRRISGLDLQPHSNYSRMNRSAPCFGSDTERRPLPSLSAHQNINNASLTNRDLLTAMWDICMYREKESARGDGSIIRRSMWRNSAVYMRVCLISAGLHRTERQTDVCPPCRTNGSPPALYYTPPELVNELIQSALVPVIKDRLPW